MTRVVKHSNVSVSPRCYICEEKANFPQSGAGAAAGAPEPDTRAGDRARAQARRITENAQAIAREILEKASADAKAAREEAAREGYREGLSQGKRESEERCAEALDEVKTLVRGIEEEKAALLSEYEDQIKDLALDVAQAVLNYELNVDNDAFVSIFKNAVKEIGGSRWVKLTVSENRSVFATAYADLLLSMVKDAREIKVSVLEDAPDGTLLVETQQGFVDAGVETQVKRYKAAFHSLGMPAGAPAGA